MMIATETKDFKAITLYKAYTTPSPLSQCHYHSIPTKKNYFLTFFWVWKRK